jgi:TP901 family phage tail tape measure protein
MSDDRSMRIRMRLEAMDRVTRPLRDIAGGSTRAAQALKSTRDRLKEIERAQADARGFRKLGTDIRATGQDLVQARARLSALAREMSATQTPTKKLSRAYADAQRQVSTLTAQEARQTAELRQIRQRMRDAGVATGQLGQHERDLARRFADTNREIAEQERRMRTLADRNRRMSAARQSFDTINNRATGLAAGGMSAIATGRAVANPMIGADQSSRAFESGMTDIAQKADMSRDKARLMGLEIVKAARAANQLPAMMQEGVDRLAGFGLDPKQAMAMMRPIGRAATAYKAEIADLSAAAFAANDNLKVPVEQTGRIIDIMAASGKRGAFEVKDMAGAFPQLTASMQALKSQGTPAVADLAAALQITRKGAGDSASAANNLQNLLAKINTEDTIKNFKKFGVDVPAAMKKAAAEGRSPIEEIVELTRKATKGDGSKLAFLFGDMQVQQALRPLLENTALYRQIREEALKASRVTDRDFVERMRDAEEQAQKFRVSLAALKLTGGNLLMQSLAGVRDRAAGALDWLNAASKNNPIIAARFAKLGLALAGFFLIAGGGAIAIAGMLAPFAALRSVLVLLGSSPSAMLMGFGRALLFPLRIFPLFARGLMLLASGVMRAGLLMLANPMVAGIVLLVAALAIAGYMIWRHWDTIKGAFGSAIAFMGGLVGRFRTIGGQMMQGLVDGLMDPLGTIKKVITSIGGSIVGWFKAKLGIKSPSRVFMGLGGYLMSGLDRGIADGEGAPVARIGRLTRALAAAGQAPDGAAQPSRLTALQARMSAPPPPIERVQRLSRRVAGAIAAGATSAAVVAAPAAATPRPAPASAGGSDRPLIGELHIHAAPGMDERQLADLVARKVREIERDKRSRARSSYADDPDRDTHL